MNSLIKPWILENFSGSFFILSQIPDILLYVRQSASTLNVLGEADLNSL